MLRLLLFFTPCAIAGYIYYPHLGEAASNIQLPTRQPEAPASTSSNLLETVSQEDMTGSWALSPRSMGLVSSSLGASGKRGSLSLEPWGGGEANVTLGKTTISGPIAWSTRAGIPATVHVSANKQKYIFHFSKLGDQLTLVMDVKHVDPTKTGQLRFLKTS